MSTCQQYSTYIFSHIFFFFLNSAFPSLLSCDRPASSNCAQHRTQSQRGFWLFHTCNMAMTRRPCFLSPHLAPTPPQQCFVFRTTVSVKFQESIGPHRPQCCLYHPVFSPTSRKPLDLFCSSLTRPPKPQVAPSVVRPSQEAMTFPRQETLSLKSDRGLVQLLSMGGKHTISYPARRATQ